MEIYTNQAAQKLATIISNRGTKLSARFGVIFNLAKLNEQHKNEEYLNIALNVLRDRLNTCSGDIVSFADGDIFVLYKGNDIGLIKDAVFQMRYLFVDDPLAYSSPGVANNNFCNIFDLNSTWDEFVKRCNDKLLNGQNDNFEYLSSTNRTKARLKEELINAIESEFSELDFNYYFKEQSIWMNSDSDTLAPVIKEIYLTRQLIQEHLSDTLDIFSSTRLYQVFNDILDVKLLVGLLSYSRDNQKIGYLVGISVTTLISQEFELFDQALNSDFKRNIIICLNVEEVIGGIRKFISIRDNLNDKGYKLCLRNITYENFLLLEAEALGFDLIQLEYDPIFKKSEGDKILKSLTQKLKSLKSTHLILANCDSEAFELGKRLGIYLFSERKKEL